MKRYLSIWMLLSRSTVWKLLGIMGMVAAAEAGAFLLAFAPGSPLAQVVMTSRISLLAFAGVLLWSLVLIVPGIGKARYTLDRLAVSHRTVYYSHAAFNFLSYLLFWGFQAVLLLGLFHWYRAQPGAICGPQSMALACFRDEFLHGVLPLSEWSHGLRNICLAAGLGAGAAFPNLRRLSPLGSMIPLAVMLVVLPFAFSTSVGALEGDLLLGGCALFAAVCLLASARPYVGEELCEEKEETEDEET